MSDYAAMAQSVERYLGKVEVVGSSPISSFKASQKGCLFCFYQKVICASWKYFCPQRVYFPVPLC